MSLRLIKHVLFLSPVHSFAAGDISHLCPPKYLLHFLELSREGGLFHLESLWMDLKGLGPSLTTLARCLRISVVFCGAWNVPCKKATRLHEDAVLMAIDSSTPSAPKKGNCMSWDETSCHDQNWFKRFSFSNKSLKGKSLRFKKHQHKSAEWLRTQH